MGERLQVAKKVGGQVVDISRNLPGASEPVFLDSPEGLEVLRHSAAHVLAQAMKRLHPEAQVTIGPVIEDGFYYDFSLPSPLSSDDLAALEAEMAKISGEDHEIKREETNKEKAIPRFEKMGEKYKIEIISGIPGDDVSLYSQGDFTDLCRGPHLPRTSLLKHFKITHVAGAYWRGSEKNEMLQRVYGTAWPTKEALDDYLFRREEAAKRDHRKLGRELDLYSFLPEAPGMPFWHPRGAVVFNTLVEFSRRIQREAGYQEVITPLVMDESFWVRSGHMENFKEDMFFTQSEDKTFALKPMNCPADIMIFKSQMRSYKELPLRLMDYGVLHRNERSGTLHGLLRVRKMVQDDSHIFVTPEQIGPEIGRVLDLCDKIYSVFDMKYRVELGTKPEKALGDAETWARAESALEDVLRGRGLDYKMNKGGGAFYGPKIELHFKDSLGRSWQCGTAQVDFALPGRLDASYIGEDGKKHVPVMIHRALMGSLERFIGILVEHTAGAFPFWLAPVQVSVLPVSEKFSDYGRKVQAVLLAAGVRADLDAGADKIGAKIRLAQTLKTPWMAVVGGRDQEAGTVSLRERTQGDLGPRPLEAFVQEAATLAKLPA